MTTSAAMVMKVVEKIGDKLSSVRNFFNNADATTTKNEEKQTQTEEQSQTLQQAEEQEEEQDNAYAISESFLGFYYNLLAEDVKKLANSFYVNTSVVERFGNPAVTGKVRIESELATHNMQNVKQVIFWKIECQRTMGQNIWLNASGYYLLTDGKARLFVQNVLLKYQAPRTYCVINDSVQWVDEMYPPRVHKLAVKNAQIEDPKEPLFLDILVLCNKETRPRNNGPTVEKTKEV